MLSRIGLIDSLLILPNAWHIVGYLDDSVIFGPRSISISACFFGFPVAYLNGTLLYALSYKVYLWFICCVFYFHKSSEFYCEVFKWRILCYNPFILLCRLFVSKKMHSCRAFKERVHQVPVHHTLKCNIVDC